MNKEEALLFLKATKMKDIKIKDKLYPKIKNKQKKIWVHTNYHLLSEEWKNDKDIIIKTLELQENPEVISLEPLKDRDFVMQLLNNTKITQRLFPITYNHHRDEEILRKCFIERKESCVIITSEIASNPQLLLDILNVQDIFQYEFFTKKRFFNSSILTDEVLNIIYQKYPKTFANFTSKEIGRILTNNPKNKDLIIDLLKKVPTVYGKLLIKWRNNLEITKLALDLNYIMNAKYIPKFLTHNLDFIKEQVIEKKRINVLTCALLDNPALENKEFMLEAVKLSGMILSFSKTLKNDKELVFLANDTDVYLETIGEDLLLDPEVIKYILKVDNKIYKKIINNTKNGYWIYNDKEISCYIINLNYEHYLNISPEMKKDFYVINVFLDNIGKDGIEFLPQEIKEEFQDSIHDYEYFRKVIFEKLMQEIDVKKNNRKLKI